jgi:hypothetical protein
MSIITDYPNYSVMKNGDIINIRTNKVLKPLLKNGYTTVYI